MGGTQVFPQHPYSSSSSSSSSFGEVSRSNSEASSCSSSDTFDDRTSSSSTLTLSPDSSSSFEGCRDEGPLCKLSELMTHLPIKRGLSRHYLGKSQSFTSLASARRVQDLAKEENPHAKRLKLCVGRLGPEGCGGREQEAYLVGNFDQQQEASNSYSQDILSTIF